MSKDRFTKVEIQDGWAPCKKGYQPTKQGSDGTNPPQGDGGNGGTGGTAPSSPTQQQTGTDKK